MLHMCTCKPDSICLSYRIVVGFNSACIIESVDSISRDDPNTPYRTYISQKRYIFLSSNLLHL